MTYLLQNINEIFEYGITDDSLIIKLSDKKYQAFAYYTIFLGNIVTVKYPEEELQFSSLKHALMWCIFHKNKFNNLADNIMRVEQQLGSIKFEQALYFGKLKKPHSDVDHDIILHKLEHNFTKQKKIYTELDYLASRAYFIQQKRFIKR